MQGVQGFRIGAGELRGIDEITEETTVAQERQDVLMVVGSVFLHPLGELVHHGDGLTLFINAFGITCPGGDDGSGQGHFTTGSEVLPDHRQ